VSRFGPTERAAATAKQAGLLIFTSFLLTGFGFLFWAVGAREIPPAEVGFAAATISLASLISSLSLAGVDFSIMRFLPAAKAPSRLATQGLLTVPSIALVVSVSFVLLGGASRALGDNYVPFLVLIASLNTSSTVIDTLFIALRQNRFNVLKAASFSVVRLLLIPFLAVWGGVGIVLAFSVGTVAGILVAFVGLRQIPSSGPIESSVQPSLRSLLTYSGTNYISVIGFTTADRLAPTLILLQLGPAAASYFYIAYTISRLLFYVPESFARALLAEGSASERDFESLFWRSLARALGLVVPIAVTSPLWGPFLLNLVGGSAYAAHWPLLAFLCLQAIPFSLIEFSRAVLNVLKRPVGIIVLAALYGLINLVLFLALLTSSLGLDYTGLAWVVSATLVGGIGAYYFRAYTPRLRHPSDAEVTGAYCAREWYTAPDVASRYEQQRFARPIGRFVNFMEKRALRNAVRVFRPGAAICETACGTGRMTEVLLGLGFPTLAADVSIAMMQNARDSVKRHPGLRGFVLGDATQLPLKSESCDGLVSFRFVAHLPPRVRERFLTEAARVSREYVVISLQSPWSLHFFYRYAFRLASPVNPPFALSPRKLRRAARAAGLRVAAVRHTVPFIAETYVACLRKH